MMIVILLIILNILQISNIIQANNVPELHVKHRKFADELVQKLRKEENKNQCSSSLSASMAFGLLYPAMIGNTKTETENLFGFPNNNKQIVWEDTIYDIEIKNSSNDQQCIISIANSVWIDTNESVNPDYGSIVNDLLHETPFREVGGSIPINEWVNMTTNGLINEIIKDEKLRTLVSLVVNAIYLKAAWTIPFESFKNTEDKFYTLGKVVLNEKVLYMHQVEYLKYTEIDGYQVVGLALDCSGLYMFFVLPKDDISDLFLSTSLISDAIPSLETKFIALALPKFKHESTYDNLIESLQSLGLESPFDASRNELCVLDHPICDQFISWVIQKTVIAVDEEGVEAAAVTAVGVAPTSAYEYPKAKVFRADRPFQFFVYDYLTELVLFEGRVGNPESPEGGDALTLTNKHDAENFWNEVFGVEVEVEGQDSGGVLGIIWSMMQGIIDWLLSILNSFFGV